MCPHKVDASVKYDLSAMQHIARHRRTIENCISALTHSCLCHDAFCRFTACMKMKRVVIHTSICCRRLKGHCPICRQLIALCCYHARSCEETRCTVPFCNTVKIKLRQQSLGHERLGLARGLDLAREEEEDADEAEAIDVNMIDGPSFGDDAPSGSGDPLHCPGPADASSDSESDDESSPSGESAENPADQPLPADDSDSGESQSDETSAIE